MDTLILIVIVGAAIFIVNTLSGKIRDIHFRFEELKAELQIIRSQLEGLRRPEKVTSEKVTESPKIIPEVKPIEQAPFIPNVPPVALQEPKILIETVSESSEKVPEPVIEKTVGISPEKVPEEFQKIAEEIPPSEPPVYHEPQPDFFARFMQNNPDLEKFIGENLINKIGIAILVLGIGYFVKFAIDKEWINEIGRVFIGILAGGILIGIAHYLRKKFAAFSSVLVGGGLAVLYFTIAIAFHEYQIFSQAAAFSIMVVITGFSVLLSISYNRIELAVLAILGGFATPFMVSTGEGNYQVLFTYLLVLNIGMLVLAYLKGWKLINWICYGFTILLFSGWLGSKVLNTENGPFLGALVFATLFYIVFFLMNIINNVKERIPFVASEIWILLSNTFLYYAVGMTVLSHIQNGLYQGLFTAAVAVFNFLFAFLLFRSQKVDRNLVYLLIGLVITFISLAIPVQLEGNYITMFWALEAVLLLWFGQRTGIRLAFASSIVISGLMLISLIMDWDIVYQHYNVEKPLTILINKGFITGFISLLSLAASYRLLKNDPSPVRFAGIDLQPLIYRRIIGYGLVVLSYLVLLLELNYQLNIFLDSGLNRTIILGCFNLA